MATGNQPRHPHNQLPDPLGEVGRAAIWRAETVLAVRQLFIAFWPFALVLKLAMAMALFGLFPFFGPLGHTLLSLGFGAALIASFVYSYKHHRSISEGEARRAVERASGLAHRPLTALVDTAAVDGGLWSQHRHRAAQAIKAAALQVPSINLRGMGSPVLRYGSWVALVAALLFAWDEAPRRLQEATEPPVEHLLPVSKLDAWVTPPAYTGQPPIALRADQRHVTIPEGSTLTVRITGGWFPPVLELPTGRQRLQGDGADSYQYTAPISQSGWLKIRQDGRYLGQWALSFMLDMPPSIEFNKPPEATEQMALRLDYKASDDIGLTAIEAEIEPAIASIASPHLKPLVLALPLAQPPPRHANAFRFFDLTAHPLAGSKVLITLRAHDGKNQVAETTPIAFTLPERRFTNPIAKSLIRLRKEVLVRGLAARHPGAELASGLAEEAEESERADLTGALALRVIAARLRLTTDTAEIPGLERLIWDTALHFEDGGAGQALNQLRQAQQALEDALSNGASDAELAQLMQQLEQAMNDYLDQLQQQDQQAQQQDGEGNVQMLDRQDIQNMLEQMRQLAQSGSRDQAREMLQQMQQMMENMQSRGQGQGDPQLSQDMQRLGEIARQQQGMMQSQPGEQQQGQSQSGEAQSGEGQSPAQNGEPQQGGLPQPGEGQAQQQAQQQEGLRRELGDVMQGLAERRYDVGRLGQGERSMNDARQSLEQGEGEEAAGQQGQALEHLREGMNSLQQQAQQRSQGSGGSDPFGRRQQGDGGSDTSHIDIPDRQAAERARQVLEELRRRAGDYSRPPEERDYLERLLKWF